MKTKNFNRVQYEANVALYLESNKDGKIGGLTGPVRVAKLQRILPVGRKVFEIGSGGGDEASLLIKAGYDVIASDFIEGFVRILETRGLVARTLDAKKDAIASHVDAVYANAVFVHFSPDELLAFLKRTRPLLSNERLIYFTVIKGEGHKRESRSRGFERDFYYYSTEQLREILRHADYTIESLEEVDDAKWIQVIAKAQ